MKKIFAFIFKTRSGLKKIIIKDVFFTVGDENIQRTIKSLKKMIPNEGGAIIDVGAFDGETAIAFSKAFPGSEIIALEANPETYKTAAQNCSSYNNIKVLNLAASGSETEREMNITQNDVSSSLEDINQSDKLIDKGDNSFEIKNKVLIKTTTLDSLTKDKKIMLLKVDTQGHELEVLAGATETLKSTSFVLIEMANHQIYKNGARYYEVDEVLRNKGFQLFDIIVTYRKKGIQVLEYDAVYINNSLVNE